MSQIRSLQSDTHRHHYACKATLNNSNAYSQNIQSGEAKSRSHPADFQISAINAYSPQDMIAECGTTQSVSYGTISSRRNNPLPNPADHGWIATPYLHNQAHARLTGYSTSVNYLHPDEVDETNAIEITHNDRSDDGWNGKNCAPTLLDDFALFSPVDDPADLLYRTGHAAQQRRLQRTPLPVLETLVERHEAKIDVVVVMEEDADVEEVRQSSPGSGSTKRVKRALDCMGRKLRRFNGRWKDTEYHPIATLRGWVKWRRMNGMSAYILLSKYSGRPSYDQEKDLFARSIAVMFVRGNHNICIPY